MAQLAGRHVVVTGASSGIGEALALELGRQGCRVTIAARRMELLQQVERRIAADGGEAHSVQCDVTSRDNIFALAGAARGHFGEIDGWINNAGGGILHNALEATEEDMLWQYRLNCLSVLWAWQAVIPGWLERGRGHMVDINSLAGKAGFAYAAGYVAAKGAMGCMGDAMRQEVAGTGVHVTTVYVGLTDTDFSDARPDRSNGKLVRMGEKMSRDSGLLRRTVLSKQSPEYVARRIAGVLRKPRPVLYPHRWGALAVLVNNLWPGLALAVVARARARA